jgi:hypothetical protein
VAVNEIIEGFGDYYCESLQALNSKAVIDDFFTGQVFGFQV